MKNQSVLDYIKSNITILDGASGTQMQKRGMPAGVSPETFAIENPHLLAAFQREYYEAGSDIVYAFTFGANLPKLKHYGISEDKVMGTNEKIAKISCEVRDEMRLKYPGRNFYVAGDLAPTGEFLEPAGTLSFKQLIEIYKQQAKGLLNAGVDLFVVETMMDLNQTRAAVIAIKKVCNLPIFATLTFDHGRTLSGEKPLECLITLEALGVAAFGANCSTGPKEMAELLFGIPETSSIPIIAKPNAGMPEEVNGETVFPMNADDFANAATLFLKENVGILGGCCGTTPGHIEKLNEKVKLNAVDVKDNNVSLIENINQADSSFNNNFEIVKVKDMICSSQKNIEISKIDIKDKSRTVYCKDPLDLSDEISDINSGITPGNQEFAIIDFIEYEKSESFSKDELMEGILNLGMYTKTPIVIRSADIQTIKTVGASFCGRIGIIDSADLDQKAMDAITFYGLRSIQLTDYAGYNS